MTEKLYKVETNSLKFPVTYILAESIEDCLFKARKYFESTDSVRSHDLYKDIKCISLVANIVIK